MFLFFSATLLFSFVLLIYLSSHLFFLLLLSSPSSFLFRSLKFSFLPHFSSRPPSLGRPSSTLSLPCCHVPHPNPTANPSSPISSFLVPRFRLFSHTFSSFLHCVVWFSSFASAVRFALSFFTLYSSVLILPCLQPHFYAHTPGLFPLSHLCALVTL